MSKGLEALESIIETFYDKESKDIQIVRKELKALEIIKKYNFRPSDFHYCTTYKSYRCNMSFADEDEIMSEEDYNLLKEVLS